ncbi:hypothetical protein nbrc107696_10120 [Gordonia spumicola]|uniref:Uncharacterized protein n=1 Tax=Gordonia spumicola TaxID=589161 RepID=A0A7I9V5A1_9ACTN|nr:hypothetical protein nbrc107696_10120 [Gordonia spumicola]
METLFDLLRRHRAAEDAGEAAVDGGLELALESVEKSHPFPSFDVLWRVGVHTVGFNVTGRLPVTLPVCTTRIWRHICRPLVRLASVQVRSGFDH